MNIIRLVNIAKSFGCTKALDDISLSIKQGESLGLVGESGSGKTTLARIILGLIKPDSGEINYDGISNLRRECQIVFQDPQTSLNPSFRIGDAIAEPLIIHKVLPKEQIGDEVGRLLELVKLPREYAKRWPGELSGGERQRVGIARALILKPKFLILDEPVSALDLAVQTEILRLLKELKTKFSLTYLFIAHDLGVIGTMCDRIAVMQSGRIVEVGTKEQILGNPQQAYTQKLLASVLKID